MLRRRFAFAGALAYVAVLRTAEGATQKAAVRWKDHCQAKCWPVA